LQTVYNEFNFSESKEAIMRKMHIELSKEEAEELNKRLKSRTVSVRDQRRSLVILLAADGKSQDQIAY
jgi:hypothetical protein